MARPREFDTDVAIERAMGEFWCRGFEATSIGDLVDATGVARQSLYGAFRSKEGLYLAALDRYRELEGQKATACLDRPDVPPLARIRDLFERLARESLDDPLNRGCFVLNAALERQDDPEVAKRVRAGLAGFESRFRELLEEADLPAGKDPSELARFLVTALQGVRVMAKATRDERLVRDAVEVALRTLE